MRRRTAHFWVPLALVACAATIPDVDVHRVTFIGDSITSRMGQLTTWFGPEAQNWVNAGVAGETSRTELMRIESVEASAACVILVGINDLSNYAGDGWTNPDILPPGRVANGFSSVAGNIRSMTESLQSRGIRPVIATVLPVVAVDNTAGRVNAKIVKLNAWLRTYAQRNEIAIVDYYGAFIRPDSSGRPELYDDSVHPNAAGRAVMARIAGDALHSAGILQ